jgi:hypothetical protein
VTIQHGAFRGNNYSVDTMDLRDFVSTALLDIIEGVKDAQMKTSKGTIVPDVRQSYKSVETGISELTAEEFEVTVKSGKRAGSQAKLSVVAAVVGGKVKGESGRSTGQTAKLTFRVPVRLPVSK